MVDRGAAVGPRHEHDDRPSVPYVHVTDTGRPEDGRDQASMSNLTFYIRDGSFSY